VGMLQVAILSCALPRALNHCTCREKLNNPRQCLAKRVAVSLSRSTMLTTAVAHPFSALLRCADPVAKRRAAHKLVLLDQKYLANQVLD
jgi:hypothetical protein